MNAPACGAIRATRAGVRAGRFLVCVVFGLLTSFVAAKAPPATTSLFPPGVTSGARVDVEASGKFPSWPLQVRVERFGRVVETLRVECSETGGKLHIDASEAAPGAYTIRLYDADGATAPCPFRVGTLPEEVEIEPNGSVGEAQRLSSADVVVNGRLQKSGDVDGFAFELHEGEGLVASIDAHVALGSPMDATLQILSADGFVLAENDDDAGLDPRLVFRAPATGLYLVRTLAFPALPNQSIQLSGSSSYVYRMTLTTGPFVTQAFPMAVSENGSRTVSVIGWNRKFLPRDLEVTIEPRAGYATLTHGRLANTLELPVVPHASVLEVATGGSVDQRLELPLSVTGRIEHPDERDRYTFAGRKGKTLRFEVFARRWGSLLDAVVRVRDSAGKEVASNDDSAGRDARLDFSPGADGDYTVEITDLYSRGGERLLYCLRSSAVTPDFDLEVATSGFLLLVDEPLEIPVTVARRDGFDAKTEVALVAEGLPDHVAVELKTTEKKDGPPQLSLVLTTKAPTPFQGPFTIYGRGGDLERRATAGLVGFPSRTTSFWLTVREPERKRL